MPPNDVPPDWVREALLTDRPDLYVKCAKRMPLGHAIGGILFGLVFGGVPLLAVGAQFVTGAFDLGMALFLMVFILFGGFLVFSGIRGLFADGPWVAATTTKLWVLLPSKAESYAWSEFTGGGGIHGRNIQLKLDAMTGGGKRSSPRHKTIDLVGVVEPQAVWGHLMRRIEAANPPA